MVAVSVMTSKKSRKMSKIVMSQLPARSRRWDMLNLESNDLASLLALRFYVAGASRTSNAANGFSALGSSAKYVGTATPLRFLLLCGASGSSCVKHRGPRGPQRLFYWPTGQRKEPK